MRFVSFVLFQQFRQFSSALLRQSRTFSHACSSSTSVGHMVWSASSSPLENSETNRLYLRNAHIFVYPHSHIPKNELVFLPS